MKVSVIIPTYNEENVIVKCLESLDGQTHDEYEVIVVDDGSTDNTLRALSKLQIANYKLQTYKQRHKGPAMARNLGAKYAKGKILVFVDADMTFEKNFLMNLVNPITERKSKGTFSKEEYVSNWDNVWARMWNLKEGWKEKRRHPENYPETQKVFRAVLKSEFDRVGGFNRGGYTDDYTLSEKLGYEATVAKKAMFYHKNPDSLFEVFVQAKWASKREYKSLVIALIRTSPPVSVLVALVKAILHPSPAFFVFKLVYDFGAFLGILEYSIFEKVEK